MLITRGESIKEITTIVNEWYRLWPESFHNMTIQDTIRMLRTLIVSKQLILLVLFEGSIIVSSCCVCTNTCEILNLFTIPDFRNQGYATRLLREAIQIASDINLPRLHIQMPKKYQDWILREFDSHIEQNLPENQILICIENNPMSPIFRTLQENA